MSELTKIILAMMKYGFTIQFQPVNSKMLSLFVYHVPTNTEVYSQISFESLQLAKTDIIKEELEKAYKQYIAYRPEHKSNINNSFFHVFKSGICQATSKLTSCPSNPNYDSCHNCPNWVECIPV